MRKYLWLGLLALVLVACDYVLPDAIPIQSVDPVTQLPSLPARGAAALMTYTEALNYAEDVKNTLNHLGGQIDIGANDGYLDCRRYFDLYQQGAALPVLTVARMDDALLVWAAGEYNTAVAGILEAGRDTYNHCEAFLLGKATQNEVAPLSWTLARHGVTESVARLDAIIKRMRDELPDPTTYVGVGGQVLKATREALDLMGDMGYELDKGLCICPTFIEKYEQMTVLPEINVTNADATVQAAYEKYRWAVDEATRTSHDNYLNCEDFMTTGSSTRRVPPLGWNMARKGLNDAMTALHQAEESLKVYGK